MSYRLYFSPWLVPHDSIDWLQIELGNLIGSRPQFHLSIEYTHQCHARGLDEIDSISSYPFYREELASSEEVRNTLGPSLP